MLPVPCPFYLGSLISVGAVSHMLGVGLVSKKVVAWLCEPYIFLGAVDSSKSEFIAIYCQSNLI